MNDKMSTAPSRDRGEFLRLLPSIIVVLTAALAIPFASNFYMGAVSSGICAFFLIATAKKKIPVLLLLLLLLGVFGLPGGLPMITLILAFIVGTGTFSWLIAYTRSPYLAIVPVFAYSVTTVITKNWFGSMLALVFAIPALILAIALISKASRLGALCRTSATFVIISALAIVFSMLYFRGEFRFDVLKEYAEAFTESIADIFSSYEVELINGEIESIFSEEESYNIALRLVTLFPAITVLFFNAISFFAQRLQFALVKATLPEDTVSPRMAAFITSPGAGIVYLLSFLVSTLTDSSPLGNTVNTVCQNIFVILTPALLGMGIMYFFAKAAIGRLKAVPLTILAIIVLAFFNTQAALLLISCFGAYASVAIPLTAYLKEKMNKE